MTWRQQFKDREGKGIMDIGEKNKIGDKKLKFKMIYHSMSSFKKYLLS